MTESLKLRIITAVILAPLVLSAVFFLPKAYFAIVFWAITALAAYEWAGFFVSERRPRLMYVLAYGALCLALYGQVDLHRPLIVFGVFLWGLAAVAVLLYPRGSGLFRQGWLLAPLGLLLITVAWLTLLSLKVIEQGSLWILWVLLVVWAADIGAYFAGKSFGRRKLAPRVSPGKTWEGLLGGAALAVAVCGSLAFAWQEAGALWFLITLALSLVAVFGDLFESLLKRATGVKDSGTLLPGHGGVLDRVDSALAVLPVLAIILL